MPGPQPKAAALRQRQNRTSTRAKMSAPPATKTALPDRYSTWACTSCYLRPGRHSEEFFDKEEIAPHDFVPAKVAWNPMTLSWWATVWDSPMAGEWVDADVPGLTALAFLVDEFWRTGAAGTAAEIRLQQREYGLSPFARRALQWEILRVDAATPKPPARQSTRRKDPRLRLVSSA